MVVEVDIASKIRNARKECGLTQEQAADLLGVSRQTISNWENEKTYPDIISVIKMSERYDVSLDYLLKGERPMSDYYDYLEESTNVVKSNERKSKIMVVMSYLVVWAIAMIAFWSDTESSDAMGYAILYLWLILPVTTFVVSLIIGRRDYWGSRKWIAALVLGVMYMLSAYGTFSLANNIYAHHINPPDWEMIAVGGAISLLGLLIGHLTRRKAKAAD